MMIIEPPPARCIAGTAYFTREENAIEVSRNLRQRDRRVSNHYHAMSSTVE
jgi:hypothetical protein